MKVILERLGRACVSAFLILTATASFAQSGYTVVARGLDSKVLQKVVVRNGVTNVHAYTELATGMNYTNGYGQLVEAQEQITISPNGGASATQGRHKVYFPGDIGGGVLQVVTPDGRNLYSRPLGVSYDDGTNTVFVATLTNAVGYLTSSNQVTYRNCFNGIQADLVCTYRKGGFECDLVFRAQPPTPDQFGLDADFTTLQLVTEFFNTQDPQQIPSTSDEWYGLQDSTLKFGKLTMKRGKAFATRSSPNVQTPVYKSWVHEGNRKFLVEEVPLLYLADALDGLPLMSQATPAKTKVLTASNQRRFPAGQGVSADTNQILIASTDLKHEAGVVLDYTAIDASQDVFTFEKGMTYYAGSSLEVSPTIIFAGGSVIKSSEMDFDYCTNVVCSGGLDSPTVFTSPNDDSVGEIIDGSTGTPVSGEGTYLSGVPNGCVLRNLRFYYSSYGIETWAGGCDIQDCQFFNFYYSAVLSDSSGNQIGLHNVLLAQDALNADADYTEGVTLYGGTVVAENVTADKVCCFIYDVDSGSQLFITNCLITETGFLTPWSSFYTNQVVCLASPAGQIYQSAGRANYYLAPNSPYRGIGTTNMDPDLLAELQTMTTFAPQDGGWPDTNGTDIGYHYSINESSRNDGIPDWWIWQYFGNYNETATNLDANENTLLYDYQNGLNPNVIKFTLSTPSLFVNQASVPVQINLGYGQPSYYAVLVNDTNLNDAVWQPFTDTNLTVNLGLTDGVYDVWVGLRGHADTAGEAVWDTDEMTFTLDRVAPVLAVSNPNIVGCTATVSQPWLQILGNANKDLSRLSYDLTNAAGAFTNQDAFVVDYTAPTNFLQAYDVPLTNGVNAVTLKVVDLAGNVTTTNFTVVLDYSGATTPTIQLTWPQNGKELCGDEFTVRGWTEDAAASVTATITDNNGDTNTITGEVERSGRLWAEHLPLNAGTNYITLTVTNAAGLSNATNFMVVKSGMTFVLTSINGDLWQPFVSVGGIISDATAPVWCNGVQGVNNGDGTWSATNVPVTPGGMACFDFSTIPPGQDDPIGNTNAEKQPEIQTYYYSETKSVEAVPIAATANWAMKTEWSRNYNADTNGNFTLTSTVDDWLTGDSSGYWPYDHTYVFTQTATNDNESDTDNLFLGNYYNGPIQWNVWGLLTGNDYDSVAGTALNIPDEDVRDYFRSIYSGPDWIHHFYAKNIEKQFTNQSAYEHLTLKVDAHTKRRLLTGGTAKSGKKNLFLIGLNGSIYSGDPFSGGSFRNYWPDGAPWLGVQSRPFTDKTKLSALGKQANVYGQVWKALPDNSAPDLGLMAKGCDHYNIDAGQVKYYFVSRCDCPRPPDYARTTVGVGEIVQIYFSSTGSNDFPEPPKVSLALPVNTPIHWTLNAGKTTTGYLTTEYSYCDTKLVSPYTEDTATVTANVQGEKLSIDFNTIEPSGIVSTIRLRDGYTPPAVGAGMEMNVFLTPTNVSFGRLQIEEPGENAITTDYFNFHPPHNHDTARGANTWHGVDCNNFVDDGHFDHAWDDWGWPIGVEGTYTWPIHPIWRVVDDPVTHPLSGWTDQVFTLYSDGTMRVDKLGHHVIRHTYEDYGICDQ